MSAAAIEVCERRNSFVASAAQLTRRASHRVARHMPLAPVLMRNAEPLVSFTFDDVPVSAHANGAAMVEAHGAHATFYVASGLLGQRSEYWTVIGRDEVADLKDRGHEIALHSHMHGPAWSFSAASFAADIERNRQTLASIHASINPRNFAYPFGQCTLARKHQLNGLVRSSRSIYAGVNRFVLDRHYLRSTELCDARLTPERLAFFLDQTRRTRGWLIFCLHDVDDSPTAIGCSRRFLDHALEAVARRGLRIATVDAALDEVAGAVTQSEPFTLAQEFSHG